MQKEINFYQEMASEHRLQEYCKGPVPLSLPKKCIYFITYRKEQMFTFCPYTQQPSEEVIGHLQFCVNTWQVSHSS